MRRCRVALAQTLSSTEAVFNPPSPPTCNQLPRLCGDPHRRRNWLFVAGDAGLRTAAVLLSLCASAKRHAINPWDYLVDLLGQLAAKPTDVTPLLPDAWAKRHLTASP